ncbi:hypothetical protein DCAR_0935563 [Daucus carota subsp. sativus]|uniref:BZIP domain-containing protein n=1 Tax=Daucus carota subsp. sativus TaxID=79200 RepID=A0A175YIH7_DAUCS|nr:PREDICTED: protein ABSCISIC ACID-INSENSITIVE 5-like [Daucus carota subsp. sativus]WOH16014.1 hypothetical protein DCAR_0935563 [Daucus carota subsp. sativus]
MSLKRGAEVWSEISRTQQSTDHSGSRQSEPAYGKMTLEEFFVRAGVVREESARQAQPPPPPSLPPQLPQLQPQPHSQLAYGMHVNYENTAASSFMVLGYGGAGSLIFLLYSNHCHKLGRKRNGPVERVIENRRKKILKNRESAAYTVELEAELNHWKVKNAYQLPQT